jgi:uncharacterized protein (UPF0276 family)
VQYLDPEPNGPPLIGLANGPVVPAFIERHRKLVDYVEVAFEQLRHSPSAARIQDDIPVLLHCSSMSVAGFTPPSNATIDAIEQYVIHTRTPWIGEHLAYLSATALEDDAGKAPPTELTYTVCPQLSEETVERVALNLGRLRSRVSVPIILENSPQYFATPGSTMAMPAFVAEVALRCDVDLLLDVTHFLITTSNMGLDPVASIREFPVERVVEVHLSGMSWQSGRWWDDHAAPAPDEAFDLLGEIGSRARPRAVTLEYNWAPSMSEAVLVSHIDRARRLLAA